MHFIPLENFWKQHKGGEFKMTLIKLGITFGSLFTDAIHINVY